MKLVFDHQIFSNQAYGGISRYFVELANHLISISNAEPVVLAPLNYNTYFIDLKANIAFGRHISKIPKSGKLFNLLNVISSRLWLIKNRPEIVHATYYNHKRSFYNEKAKIVITVHDMIHELFPNDFPPSDKTAQLKQAAVSMADHIICVSANTRDDLIRLTNVDPNKVSVVHHGISKISQNFAPDHLLPKAPYLLFVGNRNGYKNYARLLNAYAKSVELNSKFKLVCFGGGRFSSDEKKKHNVLGLSEGQVLWYEGDDSVLASLYKNAIVFVYPSLYEGFGMPPLEAMSFECPVVCSNGGSIPEIVGNAGEYFDPRNTKSITEAVVRVTQNKSYADGLRNKGNLQIKKYSWRKCADETFNIYQTLL